jgi:hypothetical protein
MTPNYTTSPPTRLTPFQYEIPENASKTPIGGTPPSSKKALPVRWHVIPADPEEVGYQKLAEDQEFMSDLRSDHARLRRRGRDAIAD